MGKTLPLKTKLLSAHRFASLWLANSHVWPLMASRDFFKKKYTINNFISMVTSLSVLFYDGLQSVIILVFVSVSFMVLTFQVPMFAILAER